MIRSTGSDCSRRLFLTKTALGVASLGFPSIIKGAGGPWGEMPAGVWPPGFQPYNILEIHLFGGVAPFESFYYRDAPGLRTRGFDSEVQNLNWDMTCGDAPNGLESQDFSTDSQGKDVNLGPLAKPLWVRPHIRGRMRVLVEFHDLLPHEAAIPLSLTGHKLGRPNFSGLGAAIQHNRNAVDQAAANGRVLPHSYALFPENGGSGSLFNLVQKVATSIGTHPGSSRPLGLRIGPGLAGFISQLDRANLGPAKAAVNALIDQYRGQYRNWLREPANGPLTRSNAFRDYDTAVANLIGADSLKALLQSAPQTISSAVSCARESAGTCGKAVDDPFVNPNNPTRTALDFAAFLLTRPPADAASYVFVLDSGLVRTILPYDVHSSNHAGDTAANLYNVFSGLASIIRDPNNPSPGDDMRIDLDTTMVKITTDFGRTPFKSSAISPAPNSCGRDHWPAAKCVCLIGGPIPDSPDNTAGRVVGSISDDADFGAVAEVGHRYIPADSRVAALVAAGVNAFESENFALSQITGALVGVDHVSTMVNVRQTILGA